MSGGEAELLRASATVVLSYPTCRLHGREQRRRRWGAPRAMLLAGAPLAAPKVQALRREIASGVTDNRMTRTRQGGRRVRNGPRRACAGAGGEATLRALPSLRHRLNARKECPQCRFGGGAFCWSRPVPHLAALRGGNAQVTDSGQSKRRILVAGHDYYADQPAGFCALD